MTGGILTLDLSLTTGWAYGRLGERPAFGSWVLGSMARPAKAFAALEDRVSDAILLHRPSQVVYEMPTSPKRSKDSDATIRLLLGLCAVAELTAHKRRVPCFEQNCHQARSKVLGKAPIGKSEDIKPIIIRWAQGRGWDVREQDDEADALLLLQYAVVATDSTARAHFFRHGETL